MVKGGDGKGRRGQGNSINAVLLIQGLWETQIVFKATYKKMINMLFSINRYSIQTII